MNWRRAGHVFETSGVVELYKPDFSLVCKGRILSKPPLKEPRKSETTYVTHIF